MASEETKQDVFDRLLKEHCKIILDLNPASAETDVKQIIENVFRDHYDSALPDNLPVIPKAVGEYITSCKARMMDLHDSMFNWLRSEEEDEFMDCYSETFARAWLDGVWRVDETGEVVKL